MRIFLAVPPMYMELAGMEMIIAAAVTEPSVLSPELGAVVVAAAGPEPMWPHP